MPEYAGIAATGRSLEGLLNGWFQREADIGGMKVQALLAREADLEGPGEPPLVTIYLYRITLNPALRSAERPAALDLHYLLTPWANSAEQEHRILGMVMECLERTPVLSGPLPHEPGGWAVGDSVQIVPEELSLDLWERLLSALPMGYRLSLGYEARIRQGSPIAPSR